MNEGQEQKVRTSFEDHIEKRRQELNRTVNAIAASLPPFQWSQGEAEPKVFMLAESPIRFVCEWDAAQEKATVKVYEYGQNVPSFSREFEGPGAQAEATSFMQRFTGAILMNFRKTFQLSIDKENAKDV